MSRSAVLALPKPLVVAVVSTAVVAVTGVAVSYWTAGGAGAGAAGTATGAAGNSLRVVQNSSPSDMGPGVPAGDITVSVFNDGTQNVRVRQVDVTIASVTPAAGATGPCSAADYALSGAPMSTGAGEVAPGSSVPISGATLGFANDAARNQDGCKGATVTLTYTAS